jgi:chemotaxis protein MotB
MSDQQSNNSPGNVQFDQAPIVKKIKKVHGGHHGGAWKVAYADFVTAMMALFIVLWVLGQNDEVKEAVAGYFKDPVGFSSKGQNILEGKNSQLIDLNIEEEIKRQEEEKFELEKMGEKLKEDIGKDTELMNISDQVKVEIIKEGLRIELIDSEKDVFFEVGTSELKADAKKLIQTVGKELSKLPNKIIVEGHTDARQYQNDGSGYSNFELSTDRANSAKRALVSGGVSEKQIDEVRGFADTRLRDVNDPFSFLNRRISITVRYTSK